ncbi:MAG TPA: transposase domain-containing protein [Paracoccaceae bacterium]|nr:transposase domain-containing protein [Paracoccaceae bacterium]
MSASGSIRPWRPPAARLPRRPEGDRQSDRREAQKRIGPLLDDGGVAIDSHATERADTPIVPGGRNFLFAGADAGGDVLADAGTVTETAKLSGPNPEAHLVDILGRIRLHDPKRLDEMLPATWRADREAEPNAA